MAVSAPVAILLSAAVSGAGVAASTLLASKAPKPTETADPEIARQAELKKLQDADNIRARVIAEQRRFDQQLLSDIRTNGLKI